MSSTTDGRVVRGRSTRLKILEAARATLLDKGTGGASTRSVADRAGVPLSLVHYHFGSKQELLAAVLEHENDLLLARQRKLYAAPGPLAEKWRTACAFLDEDLRSGYVRVLWELWAAGLADELLAERWRAAMGGWRELLESVYAAWASEHRITLPLSPRAVAALITNIFQGAEVELLAGVREREAPHREVLEAIGALIERAEAG
ncbi:MAG TPA: TetR/AcrR family transcriptional regulator [Gaiellaceae bacterium]|jgi:AcrR family transcriptional regulator|nr:TetR/AcrR family transcriptional regulator [Gaiellaceae bacterium]